MKVRNDSFGGRWMLVLALAATAVLTTGPAALAGGASLAVTSYQVNGNVVHVSVYNSGSSATTAVVGVSATLQSGMPAAKAGLVSVAGGQTATVTVCFGDAVAGVTQVGVSDDRDPF